MIKYYNTLKLAGVVELADTHGLGPCSAYTGVQVQVLSPALTPLTYNEEEELALFPVFAISLIFPA